MKLSGVLPSHKALLTAILLSLATVTHPAIGETVQERAAASMKRAATYYRETLATRGGYVYFYSEDLSRRLGEGAATETEIWVQPPGTPTVGSAYLTAYEATGDPYYLEAALETGRALLHGQLESGGWRNSIDFNPAGPRIDQYRHGKGKGKNYSTLDDDISQAALVFLINLDRVCEFGEADVNEAVQYGLDRLLAAQFANGAFPQVWRDPVRQVESKQASFPDYDWRTEGRIKEYWTQFTLNDGVAGSMTRVLVEAHRTYEDPRHLEALKKLGNFLLLAQMPDPQPAWAQQYNDEMQPIWARAFEPPAISGRESEDAILALLRIHDHTDDSRYLEPIVRAVKYLESSLLDDGRMARYYELETNRPLYMERNGKVYTLTHDDSDLPDHYGWKSTPQLEKIKEAYRAAISGAGADSILESKPPAASEVEAILSQLDNHGRWMDDYDGAKLVGQAKFAPGESYISSETFSTNLETLSRFLASQR